MLISINAIKIVLIFFFKKKQWGDLQPWKSSVQNDEKNEETRAYIKRIIQK